nr:isoprenyl transferase [Novosphingopyxis iocasae]
MEQGASATERGGGDAGPRHVAIIMDGNGRWAKKRHLPRVMGHRRGVEAVREIVRAAGDLGLEALTLYAFSSENWKRPPDEVGDLMGLLKRFIIADLEEFRANGVRLKVIGRYKDLAPDIVALIDDAIEKTAHNTRTTLAVALNYGGQDELVRAAKAMAQRIADGSLSPENADADALAAGLDTADMPPLDLLIRTSGEQRLSNFLLWQCAYAELWFTETLWPDFTPAHLAEAMADFAARERRFGGR